MRTTAATQPATESGYAAGWWQQRLRQTVRPEFAGELIRLDPDNPVFARGRCRVDGCERGAWSRLLCPGHYTRWRLQRQPDMTSFAASTGPLLSKPGWDLADTFDLRSLALPARLEVAYIIQRYHDDRAVRLLPGAVALVDRMIKAGLSGEVSTRSRPWSPPTSAFAGFRFPPEVIVVAVRWYLRLQPVLPRRRGAAGRARCRGRPRHRLPVGAAVHAAAGRRRPVRRHSPGDRWFVDETYVKVNGVWRYVYRAIDQHGQVIDVLVSARRDAAAARRFFRRALTTLKVTPSEVVTDAAPVYPAVLEELIPSAWHHVERYANNPIEADHSQLKHRLRPMRGLRTDRTAQVIIAGHAFMQNGSGTSFVIGPARAVSGGCEDAAAEEVEVGAAVHLPLDRFDAVDVSFDGAGAVGQAEAVGDGGEVALDAVGEAAQAVRGRWSGRWRSIVEGRVFR